MHEHLELPGMLEDPYIEVALQAPPSPDYIPGLEEPEQSPPLPDYVPCPEHADDEISPEYVPESDLEAYPEEDDDVDPEEDPVDYPVDGGDDDDDKEGSSKDDDMDIEADEEEEEEEHPAPADSVVVALPAADQAPSADETEPFDTDESDAPSSGIPPPLSISAHTSSPPVQLPSASHREDRPKVTLPPRKRLGIALGPEYEVGESSCAVAARSARGLRADYDFVTTMDREIRQAWVRSMDASDLARSKVMSLCTTILGQWTEIKELHAADRRRQIVTLEMMRADHMRFARIRRDSRDPLEVLHNQSYQRRLVAVHRLDHVMNELLVNVLTLTFLSVNNYTSKALRELPVFPNGWKEWMASKPKTLHEIVEIATELMDKKIRTFAERETASKRKFENTSRSTQNQQQQLNKRQNTGRVYTAASGEKKQSTANANNANNQRGAGSGQKPTCYECGVQGHFKRECLKLKNNNNHGKQGGRDNAPAKVYAEGRAGTSPDSNVVT
nr:hypothetical protein [Tanacetum cinerariifolium]